MNTQISKQDVLLYFAGGLSRTRRQEIENACRTDRQVQKWFDELTPTDEELDDAPVPEVDFAAPGHRGVAAVTSLSGEGWEMIERLTEIVDAYTDDAGKNRGDIVVLLADLIEVCRRRDIGCSIEFMYAQQLHAERTALGIYKTARETDLPAVAVVRFLREYTDDIEVAKKNNRTLAEQFEAELQEGFAEFKVLETTGRGDQYEVLVLLYHDCLTKEELIASLQRLYDNGMAGSFTVLGF